MMKRNSPSWMCCDGICYYFWGLSFIRACINILLLCYLEGKEVKKLGLRFPWALTLIPSAFKSSSQSGDLILPIICSCTSLPIGGLVKILISQPHKTWNATAALWNPIASQYLFREAPNHLPSWVIWWKLWRCGYQDDPAELRQLRVLRVLNRSERRCWRASWQGIVFPEVDRSLRSMSVA